MHAFSHWPDDYGEPEPEPLTQLEPAGPGGGGRGKTRNGSGNAGGGSGSAWQSGRNFNGEPGRKILHSHLKDMAIDALEITRSKEPDSIANMLSAALGSDVQPEMSAVLASLVMSAYLCALETRDAGALFQAYSCFSDAQLERILQVALRQ